MRTRQTTDSDSSDEVTIMLKFKALNIIAINLIVIVREREWLIIPTHSPYPIGDIQDCQLVDYYHTCDTVKDKRETEEENFKTSVYDYHRNHFNRCEA
jgi:hypothetical protein